MMKCRGFTVLELLVVVSVATILLTIGIPSFMKIIAENRRISYSSEVFNALNYARSEAISRNVSVVVCKSANGTSCTTGTNWTEGWLIYANLSGAPETDWSDGEPDDADLPLLNNDGFRNYSLTSDEYGDRVVYLSTGRAESSGQFELCPGSDRVEGRIIRINAAGRATIPSSAVPECPKNGS